MKNLLISLFVLVVFTQCEIAEKSETKSEVNSAVVEDTVNEEALIVNNIQLFKITQSPYPDAILEMNSPNDNQVLKENEKVKFNFNAVNFPFDNGAHVALWLPNEPIKRIAKADCELNLKKGNYSVLSFLCDDQELCIKQAEAYALRSFSVGENSKQNLNDSVFAVLNIFSKETSFNPILDFYLINTNISKEGNKIKLSIDKNEFQLHNWSAYTINGLTKGKHKIKIELVNNKGIKLNSTYACDSTEIVLK